MSSSNSASFADAFGKLAPAGLAVAAFVLFANYWLPSRARSKRPVTQSHTWQPSRELGNAESLATDDPLHVAYAAYDDARRALNSGEGQARWPDANDQNWLDVFCCESLRTGNCTWAVLAVSVPGGAQTEDREVRVRTRFAATTALQSAGYIGENPGVVPAVHWCFDGRDELSAYQWFARDDAAALKPPYSRVLVVWIDESNWGTHPYEYTQRALCALTAALPKQVPSPAKRVLIGPTSTDDYQRLLRDAKRHLDDGCVCQRTPCACRELRTISAHATATFPSEGELLEALKRDDGTAAVGQRALGYDRDLADRLIDELAARLPDLMELDGWRSGDPSAKWLADRPWLNLLSSAMRRIKFIVLERDQAEPQPVRVAVIAEQDSGYGRNWIRELDAAWSRHCAALETKRREEWNESRSERGPLACDEPPELLGLKVEFELFGYQRGLDARESRARDRDAEARASADYDYPADSTQIDYVQRLAPALSRDTTFKAIGIFGSDVYDKLLLLEALKPRFPDALFLTTDLDARFFHAEHRAYTRNLVIASHLGLDHYEPGKTALHFRDTYQHAVYCVVRNEATDTKADHPVPVVHEIGNGELPVELSGPYLASSSDGDATNRTAPGDPSRPRLFELVDRFLHREVQAASTPNEARLAPWPRAMSWVLDLIERSSLFVATAVILVAAVVFGRRMNTAERTCARTRLNAIAVRALLPLGVLVVWLWLLPAIGDSPKLGFAEPLELFSGTSVWPSVLLRAAVVVFCLWSIVMIRRHLLATHEEIHIDNLFLMSQAQPDKRISLRWLGGLCATPQAGGFCVIDVWLRLDRWLKHRVALIARLVAYAVALYLLVAPYYREFGSPRSPTRGEFAFVMERLSTWVSVIAFLMLVSYVVEVSFFATRLVSRVMDGRATIFPRTLAARARGDLTHEQTLDIRARMRVVEAITGAVDPLVYYPMLAVCGMIAARASVLDAWGWPGVLIGTFVGFFAVLALCTFSMRSMARSARDRSVRELRGRLIKQVGNESASKRTQLVLGDIEQLRAGVFASAWEHPLLKAAVLPAFTLAGELALAHNFIGG